MAVHPLSRKGYDVEPCKRCGAARNVMCTMYNAAAGGMVATAFLHIGRKATPVQ